MTKKYAKIDSLNEVVEIYVVDDNETQSSVNALFGSTDLFTYRETGPSIRERLAEITGSYDPSNDVFINKKPYPSWTLNNSTREWEAPVTEPTDEQKGSRVCSWNDSNQQWLGEEFVDGSSVVQAWNPETSSWE